MFKSLCKVSKQFAKAQLWKQWNKLKDRSTDNMTDAEKKIHRRALQRLEKDLHLDEEEEEEVEEIEEEDDE